MTRIDYSIEFATSFMQGAGAGVPGSLDDISVNVDGIPYVGGEGIRHGVCRCLRMMWRGRKELLCSGQEAVPVDPGAFCKDGESCLYCRMFGREKDMERRWVFSDAFLPEDTQKSVRDVLKQGQVVSWATQMRHGRNRMDRERRRAKEDFLFALGRAIPLGRYSGSVTYLGPGDPDPDEVRALQRGLQLVEGIGRGKRRGMGQVRCTQVDVRTTTAPGGASTAAFTSTGGVASWTITITIHDEQGFPARPARGNEFDTLPHVPARAIWGALAGVRGLSPDTPCTEEEMRLFYEDIRVRNAMLAVTGGACLPLPLSARRDKGKPLARIMHHTGARTGRKPWGPGVSGGSGDSAVRGRITNIDRGMSS